MKGQVGPFNQEEAFSIIVKCSRIFVWSEALIFISVLPRHLSWTRWRWAGSGCRTGWCRTPRGRRRSRWGRRSLRSPRPECGRSRRCLAWTGSSGRRSWAAPRGCEGSSANIIKISNSSLSVLCCRYAYLHYLHIYTSEVALWCSVWPKWWENVMGMWQQSFNNSVHGTLMAFLIPQMGLITILLTSALGNSFNLGLLWAFSSIMVFSPWWGKTEKWFRPTFLKENFL